VYGKELGISSVVMGTVTGILPFAFLVAKPAFGVLVDMCRRYRKCIFITLVAILALSFAAIYFIPQKPLLKLIYEPSPGDLRQRCDDTDIERKHQCTSQMMICSSDCRDEATTVLVTIQQDHICVLSHHFAFTNQTCEFTCEEDADTSSRCLYRTFPFWSFVTFMYVGCIGANVIMSITDAICFDIIGADGDYGRQRVWATVGYGVAALLSGYISTLFPQDGSTTYAPAFIIMLISVLIDIAICAKLKVRQLLNNYICNLRDCSFQ
jgi:MFS family permease